MTSCPTSWAEPICSRHRHSVLEIYRSVSRSFTQTETPSDARFWWAGAAPHERITGPDRPSATFPHRVTPWSRAATRAGGGGRRRATGAASPSNADPWPKPARYVLPLARRRAQKPKSSIGLAVACRRRRGSRPRQSIMDVLVLRQLVNGQS
jgi:hypothetical protein